MNCCIVALTPPQPINGNAATDCYGGSSSGKSLKPLPTDCEELILHIALDFDACLHRCI